MEPKRFIKVLGVVGGWWGLLVVAWLLPGCGKVICTFLYGFALGPLFPGALLVAEAQYGKTKNFGLALATTIGYHPETLGSRSRCSLLVVSVYLPDYSSA